jgi:MFS family permease
LLEYPVRERATAVAVWGASAALAAASGPPLGGLLVDVADWRWIFLVNLPIGAVVLYLGMRTVIDSRDEKSTGLPDLVGSVFAILTLGLLTLGLVEGDNWGWGSASVLLAFAGAVVFGLALAWRCLEHDRPVVDPALLAIHSFRIGSIGMLVFSAAMFAAILGNVLFLTGIWHYSVLQAGLAAVPGALATTIVARPAGRLADRFGHRVVVVPGAVLFAIGMFGLRSVGSAPHFLVDWMPWTITSGIGIGLALPILGAAAVADVAPERFGTASALSATFRQIGAVLGTAILIAIVGDASSIADGMLRADRAYLFAGLAALVSGAVTLRLVPTPAEPEKVAVPAA